MLTQKKLKELLHYNPETGVFTWLVSGNGRKVGQVAGSVNSHGYSLIQVKCKSYKAHRLAWLYMRGEWPKDQIDHINGIKDDNRWENLREATQQQNQFNKVIYKDSASKYKGVYWHRNGKKWCVNVRLNRINQHLGLFNCKHEAGLVYNHFAMKHHGEYALFNQVYNHFDVEVGRDD